LTARARGGTCRRAAPRIPIGRSRHWCLAADRRGDFVSPQRRGRLRKYPESIKKPRSLSSRGHIFRLLVVVLIRPLPYPPPGLHRPSRQCRRSHP
jgi:hypothetical protein